MITKKNVALLVHSCDRYSFLYQGFYHFFSRYWNKAINCYCYFATEENNISLPGFTNILSGKGAWADRLRILLTRDIQEEYVLYFQEDMWLTQLTSAGFFNELFAMASENNWQQVKIHTGDVYQTYPTGLTIAGIGLKHLDNDQSGFLMSHQVTLWNKEFLLQQLKAKEHPWRNEREATKRLRKLNPSIYQIDYFLDAAPLAIQPNQSENPTSAYLTVSRNGLLNSNIMVFIELLRKYNGEDFSYAAALERNYLQQVTHDGLPKPKKTDIVKRIREWLEKRTPGAAH